MKTWKELLTSKLESIRVFWLIVFNNWKHYQKLFVDFESSQFHNILKCRKHPATISTSEIKKLWQTIREYNKIDFHMHI